MAIGFVVVRKNRMLGRLLIASGFILLYLMSTALGSNALVRPLEKGYPPLTHAPANVHALVVLSGGVRDLSWAGADPWPSETSLERVVKGVSLYRTGQVPLIIVGGSGDPAKSDVREADAMARVAAGLGVPDRDIIIENTARNTVESARAVKPLLTGNRIILVTSAYHMKRSMALFKKQGFDPIPAPSGYWSERQTLSFYALLPRASNLYYSSSALSEYISFVWYKVKGDI